MQALKPIAAGILITVLLPACQAAPAPPAAGAAAVRTRFDCDTLSVSTAVQGDRLVLDLPDKSFTLPHVEAASGARYANDHVAFWSKGREATLEVDGRTETCRERREPWQEAADRGVEFRAVGEEPGWFLEIDHQNGLRLVYDYAEHEMAFPAVSPQVHDRTRTYEAVSGTHHLRVVVEERPCDDVLSGEAFPAAVSVTLGHRMLKGCGRNLESK